MRDDPNNGCEEDNFMYLDVVNNYTVIQHDVKQILDDFVVSAVSSQNYARKRAKSQVYFC